MRKEPVMSYACEAVIGATVRTALETYNGTLKSTPATDLGACAILMGSGAECAEETVEALRTQGEKVGVVRVRLFRPFTVDHLLAALPETVTALAVLDRTKERGHRVNRCCNRWQPRC